EQIRRDPELAGHRYREHLEAADCWLLGVPLGGLARRAGPATPPQVLARLSVAQRTRRQMHGHARTTGALGLCGGPRGAFAATRLLYSATKRPGARAPRPAR